jgi:drug/metabolite transporter (DMT)-like permease
MLRCAKLLHMMNVALALRKKVHAVTTTLSATQRAMLWAGSAGFIFCMLNATLRAMNAFEAQFLRYLFGLIVLLPIAFRAGISAGLRAYKPNGLSGQLWRGAVHTAALLLWFAALPHLSMADTTAIGFMTPIFVMIGAGLFLREKMVAARWVAAGIGFAGMLVVMGPKLTGNGGLWMLVMLASAPMFAGSFLITKALTKRDSPAVIVFWQALTVSAFTLPLALVHWVWPTPFQWAVFLLSGVLGSSGHWCLTNSFRLADISSTQSLKFLDLVWSAAIGFALFRDIPTSASMIGGSIICGATVWIARREAQQAKQAAERTVDDHF